MLGDQTRLRLLALLELEELTVAELAAITRLAQPRVSTHLARLREAGLVSDRRSGVSVYYRKADAPAGSGLSGIWALMKKQLNDGLVASDKRRLPEVLTSRSNGQNWPDRVAGDMERHYSPGRTWESTSRALAKLIRPGRVLDIASGDGIMAELLGDQADSMECIDLSEKVIEAGRRRTRHKEQVHFRHGDMHALPFDDASFDTLLLLHALTYSAQPDRLIQEAARVLDHGGRLLGATLGKHEHEKQVAAFGHINRGFTEDELRGLITDAGLQVVQCQVESTEAKPPNFQTIIFLAEKE